ncbi:HNH endonuclease [Streptococcus suis]|uniref:HNH endonuclease n=1 Tax=Streptococcus pluranimalium TaxID=82348 RepID=UPI001554D7C3|nr:hypothetical protein [Streptococcus suis]
MTEEIWRDSLEFPEVLIVSNLGNVATKDRIITYRNGKQVFYKGHLLSKTLDKQGYERITLSIQNRCITRKVHRLVAEVFCSRRLEQVEVNHINGIKNDNRISNLEWVTRKENVAHALETKLFIPAKNTSKVNMSGENNPSAKLSDKEVDTIRRMRKSGVKLRELSELFGVSIPYLSLLCNQKYR